jgi:predicted nuclease with RNAse H fold
MFQIAGLPKFVCPQTIYGLRPRRRKMTLDTSIEAAGATVIETQPIPSNKNAGEHEHPSRGRNGTPFHQLAAAIPGRHGLSSTDYGIC